MIINRTLTYITFLILFLVSLFAVYSDIDTINKKITNIKVVASELEHIIVLKNIILELQKERGLASIYYTQKDELTLKRLQRQEETLSKILVANTNISKINTFQERIKYLHQQIAADKLTQTQIFQSYTSIISSMLLETKKLLLYTNDQKIKNHFYLFQNTNFVQEYLGQLRASIGSILAKREISDTDFIKVIKLTSLVENYIYQTKENLKLENIQINSPLHKKCFLKTTYIIDTVIKKELSKVKETPLEWFQTATCAINSIESNMDTFLQQVKVEISKKQQVLETVLLRHLIFWIVTGLISFIFTLLLFKTDKEMRIKQKLLKDYKKAIDNSTIVSKTDKNGNITYVNKAFCKISGYKEEELIGKPHNIVRDPSTEKQIFKELWRTIQSGHTWNGQIVNRAKDNSQYWVEASISPIFDDANNLVEYIAIRHDITEIVQLNEEVKNTQYELIYRLGESVESRSRESGNHIKRVAHYSKLLALYNGNTQHEAEIIFIASTMHDVGKIAIADSILLKPDKLTNEEYEIMKTHSFIGYKILSGSNLPILQIAADIAHEHHERYDGKGYPNALQKDEISIYAKIVAIADVFDALISERVYKSAWPLEKVIKLFKEESGKQFDPKLTQLLLDNIDDFVEIKNRFED